MKTQRKPPPKQQRYSISTPKSSAVGGKAGAKARRLGTLQNSEIPNMLNTDYSKPSRRAK